MWRGAESNCRHRGFQPRALPTELPRLALALAPRRRFLPARSSVASTPPGSTLHVTLTREACGAGNRRHRARGGRIRRAVPGTRHCQPRGFHRGGTRQPRGSSLALLRSGISGGGRKTPSLGGLRDRPRYLGWVGFAASPAAKVRKILAEHGVTEVRRRGSHIVMQRRAGGGTRTIPVPDHSELRIGTLQSIIRQSEIPRSEFESG